MQKQNNQDALFDDDFFNQPKALNPQTTTYNQDDPNDHKKRYINLFIILAYIIFMFVSSILGGLIGSYHRNNTSDWVDESISTTWTETDDGYLLHFEGFIKNQTDETIDQANILFEIKDIDRETIATLTYGIESLSPGETRVIDDTFTFQNQGVDIDISSYIPIDNAFANGFQFLMTLSIAIVLFILNRKDFKNDFMSFKKSPKTYFGHIATGFVLVYIAAFTANVIMINIGVTETSQNEMAIQSMFSSDWISIVTLFLTLVIFTPIVEETVFRKGLYNLVRPGVGDVGAIFISGLVFAFLHVASWGDFIQVIPYAFMGLSFSFIYFYSNRNIYVVIAIHALNNLIPYLIYTTDILG